MNKLLGHLVTQFRQFSKSLTPVKRLSIAAASIISLVSAVVILMMVTGTNNVRCSRMCPPISFPRLWISCKNAVSRSKSATTDHDHVPKELLHATEMAIMDELGGANVGHVGLELFDKQDFGATSDVRRINYSARAPG